MNTFGRVHYVTLEAMLEAPEGSTSYAILVGGGIFRGVHCHKQSLTTEVCGTLGRGVTAPALEMMRVKRSDFAPNF